MTIAQSPLEQTGQLSAERIVQRPRRLRRTAAIRAMVAETRLDPADFVLPLFAVEGLDEPRELAAMPGVRQHTKASLQRAVHEAAQAGVGAVMLFATPAHRDPQGSEAWNPEGILANAVRWAVEAEPGLPVVADVCLDEFTDHGHCGVLAPDGSVDNDATLPLYAKMSCTLADAGAAMLGPSGMMDGQIGVIREALDRAGHCDTVLMAYSAKYASGFFGPFREAVDCQLTGDRRAYQQDPANVIEGLREVELDLAQGADIVMVKPALAYLDVLTKAREISNVPVAAYVVSGEYAMIEFAARAGAIDRKRCILEALTAVKRAGASLIVNYWATEVAGWLRSQGRS
ncbi:porphobilinogen synthase [Propionibacterium cyclohexanicum]|uniref:Delta-aminolevulinic acid dehydratase n=1 Tax=Propionibacterium cyclohexanicum TaxID=64702 RepID=A0A1H9SV67_9ACTN|nr:porphobilinogen synthase [Propionibacterium cyclohexanicum]SER88788.1 porphobilinogen synthase [Propionibacterium cyclohexanicum]